MIPVALSKHLGAYDVAEYGDVKVPFRKTFISEGEDEPRPGIVMHYSPSYKELVRLIEGGVLTLTIPGMRTPPPNEMTVSHERPIALPDEIDFVASAMYRVGKNGLMPTWGDLGDDIRESYRVYARAAIGAMAVMVREEDDDENA